MTDRTFKWWLRILDPNQMPSDEFVADGFRIKLGGNYLELSFEGSGAPSADAAGALAQKYVGALQSSLGTPIQLMTDEQIKAHQALPPYVAMPIGHSATREDRERTFRAVDAARNKVLANADPALRRVYGYLRDAQGPDGVFQKSATSDCYKAIETIENAFGGEAQAGQILGCLREIKAVKRAANDPTGDERHAPKDAAATPPRADIGQVFADTLAVVRAYEAYLFGRRS
jgi:hypothetical protein